MRKFARLLLSVVLLVGLGISNADASPVDVAKARVNALSAEFQETATTRQTVAARIAEIEARLPQLESQLAVMRVRVVDRAVQVYKNSGNGSLALLLNADYRTFKRQVGQAQNLANRDAKLIKSYSKQLGEQRAERDLLASKRTELEQIESKQVRLRAVVFANAEIGKPYVYGSAGGRVPGANDSFDCSGLTAYVYAQVGVKITAYSGAQWNETERVSQDQLEIGDLVFYGAGGSDHVSIWVGDNVIISAPRTGDVVKYQEVYGSPSGYGRVAT